MKTESITTEEWTKGSDRYREDNQGGDGVQVRFTAETCFHSSTRSLVWSDAVVGWLGLARSRSSNSSLRCSMGSRSGQSSSSTPFLTHHFYIDFALCTGALSCWNRKGPSPNCCHNGGSAESSRIGMYAVALRFLFTGTKGPEPWKTAPDHYSSSTKLYSWHYALSR